MLLAHIKVGELRGFENIYDLLLFFIFFALSGNDNHDLNFPYTDPCHFFHIVFNCDCGFAFYSQLEERTRWREYRKTMKSLGIWENRSFSRTTVVENNVHLFLFSLFQMGHYLLMFFIFYFIHGLLENWLITCSINYETYYLFITDFHIIWSTTKKSSRPRHSNSKSMLNDNS